MMSYITIFSFSALLGLLSLDRNKNLTLFIPFSCILVIVFVGLRYDSVDYFNYWGIFNYINYYS
ncbi:hypothetical protein QE250_16955, partial [Chromatiaceae bacterium AAb-1]|nr:hypothetical protein [Chromatiaceae bacterium AAb-1]